MLYRLLILALSLYSLTTPAQASRDDLLVIVNDNSIDSPQVGAYYAQQRDINPANIVHVNIRPGYFISWDEFRSLRDQIIDHMQHHTLTDPAITPVTCTDGDTVHYCQASMDQLRQYTKIRYVVTTRGVPTRTEVNNSPFNSQPVSAPTSVDNYLKFWLINYYPVDTVLSSNARAVEFGDGRGMREIDPQLDKELIVGRIDGVNLASALTLVDRTLEAERNGIYGKLYGSQYGSTTGGRATWTDYSTNSLVYGISSNGWRYQLGLFDESAPECNDYLNFSSGNASGKAPAHCLARLSDGRDPPPGTSGGRAPTADDALVYLGSLDGQVTGLGNFSNLLNWKKDASCSVTLCENAPDPAACRMASTDAMQEINTDCVGVSNGFMGYNFQSFPVSFLTVWPTAWRSTNGGDFKNLAFPEVRSDVGFDDNQSLWFRNADQISNPKCNTVADIGSQPPQDCPDQRRIFTYQTISIPTQAINTATPQQYRVSLRYKADSMQQQATLRATLKVREQASKTEINYGTQLLATISSGTTDWTYAEVVYTLNPALHTQPDLLFDRLKIELSTAGTYAGEIGLDVISLQEIGVGIELLQNGSFTEGHKSVSGGDHAANYLSRLNGLAFWGSVSHHESAGFSFENHPVETLLYFMRGLPLGDAVWFNEFRNSGIFYGDPVYSPMSVKFDYLPNPGDRIVNSMDISGNTVNGRDPLRVTTDYRIDYCPGDDFFVCDQQQSWLSTGLSGKGGLTGQTLGNWDVTSLPYGDYTLRLSVTSSNVLLGRTQTFNDFYPVKNRYATDEIPTYRIAGTILDQSGQPVRNVTIQINDNSGFSATVTTNVEGRYSKDGLANGLYIVLPKKTGHTFVANSGNIFQSVSNSNVVKNFTAHNLDFTVSGTVTDGNGQPIVGAIVQINDNSGFSATVQTNINGRYSRPGISNGLYIVEVTKNGYSVSPSQGNIFQSVNGSDITKDYVATPSNFVISGAILDTSGKPVPGVTVSINDNSGFSSTVTSNANGFYEIGGLSNGLYIAFPAKQGYTIVVNGGNVFVGINGVSIIGKDFTATPVVQTYSISGYILENGQPLSGASVQINSNFGFSSTTTTDNSGFYTQRGLKDGAYIVYSTKPGYQITTVTGNIFQSINGSNIIGKDFNATLIQ
ncbi:MAG TPA: TIGR03790 family protein [Gammaproteobacteria bacterium]|nr:TIGR03790 family protein [Gammaproteobacteria bacterium]